MNRQIHIVADEQLLGVKTLCEPWSYIRCMPAAEIAAADLSGTDALLVRSTIPVTRQLLAGTAIKFVGSATIGIDHIDVKELGALGIQLAHAPGCNANAVVDYVMSVLLSQYTDRELADITVGIIGFGNTGKRLARCLDSLSIAYRVFDPLVDVPQRVVVTAGELEYFLSQVDVISLHVPLTKDTQYPTYHWFDQRRFSLLSSHAMLINSSRGAVVDSNALVQALAKKNNLRTAIDVWEGEPNIPTQWLSQVTLATGHIAGYSEAGKLRGTHVIADRLKQALYDLDDTPLPYPVRDNVTPFSTIIDRNKTAEQNIKQYRSVIQSILDIDAESERFRRQMAVGGQNAISRAFADYRKNYALRAEIDYCA